MTDQAPAASVPKVVPGSRVYAVGDIHGRADLLADVLARISSDDAARAPARTTEVFIGDVIDRGPDSRAVIELLMAPSPRRRVVLRGNHEEMMLRFLEDPSKFAAWRHVGAFETLMSYGLSRRPATKPREFAQLRKDCLDAIPETHLLFLRSTQLWHLDGDYLFVHAGVRPGVAFVDQQMEDLLWIREPFLSFTGDFGKHVVHGHTPVDAPQVFANRTNIDTGAYATGRLTCMVIEADGYAFI